MTPPDWGQDHLSVEAVAAYVDGELAAGPHARATSHLGQCPDCAAQVSAQGQARKELRSAGVPAAPSALLSSLRAIPQAADLPGPPPGLAVTADGELVSVLRPERVPQERAPREPIPPRPGFRADVHTTTHHASRGTPARRPPAQRRLRVGTGLAASGLAVGALFLVGSAGAPSAPAAPSTATPAAHRGLPTGAGLSGTPRVVDAQLRLGPGPAAPGLLR